MVRSSELGGGDIFPTSTRPAPRGTQLLVKRVLGNITWGHSGLGMALTTHLISAEVKESLAHPSAPSWRVMG